MTVAAEPETVVRRELAKQGINLGNDSELLEKVCELKSRFDLSTSDLCDKLDAYLLSHDSRVLKLENISDFSDLLAKDEKHKITKKPSNTNIIYNRKSLKQRNQQILSEPIQSSIAVKTEMLMDEGQETKFISIGGLNEENISTGNNSSDENVNSISFQKISSLSRSAKGMNDSLTRLSDSIDAKVMLTAEDLLPASNEMSFEHPGIPLAKESLYAGVIRSDNEGRISTFGVMLESTQNFGNGCIIPLDLGSINQTFPLFEGEIVALKGNNPSGEKIQVNELYWSRNIEQNIFPDVKDGFGCAIFSGPYKQIGNHDYDLFFKTLKSAQKAYQSRVIVLDSDFDHLKNISNHREWFKKHFLAPLRDFLKDISAKAIIIPSIKDFFSESCCPQRPLFEDEENIFFLSNPCIFEINGITFGVAANGAMDDLNPKITIVNKGPSESRIPYLWRCFLNQKSFYPLNPGPCGIDYSHYEKLQFDRLDVLIVPSRISSFADNIDGTVCVNPGNFMKSSNLGSMAILGCKSGCSVKEMSVQLFKIE